MAEENKIFYKIEVHGEQGLATIRNMKGQFIKTKVPVEDLNKVMSNMNGTMAITSSEAGRQMAKLKGLRSNVQINSKEYQNLTKAMMSYQKVLDGTGRATGASASAAMELGRIVSDMPYGIRGVANNLSQFASQMAFSAKATGSLKMAIKDLFSALTGPLGILLVIQGVIAALDNFSQKKKEAKEASEEHNKALKKEISTLKGLVDISLDVNSTVEDRNRVVVAAIASNKDYAKSVTESSNTLIGQEEALRDLLEEKQKQLSLDQKLVKLNELNNSGLQDESRSIDELKDRLIELQTERKKELESAGVNRARAIIMSYQKELTYLDETIKKLEDRKEILKQIEALFEPPRQVVERSVEWYKQQISFAEKTRDQLSTTSKAYRDQTKVIEGLREELEKITGKKGGEPKKISPFKTPKELEIDLKSNENAIIQMNKKIEQAKITEKMNEELAEAKTEEEKKKIREKYAVEKLRSQIDAERKMLNLKMATEKEMIKTKTKNHIDDLKRATDLYLLKIKLDENLTDKQKAQATRVAKSQFAIAKNQATGEEVEAFEELKEKYKPLFKLFEDLGIARMNALMSGFGLKKSGSEEEEFTFEQGLQKLMEVTSAATDFMNSEFDRQITIERNKTNALNNELNKRLLNENLSKEERKRIQLEIGANDEKLRKTQEKIEKKRFKLNKAANIAQATISAYLAGAQVLANEKLGAVGRIVAMTAVISSGLLQVAAIARTKFQSSAGSGGQIGGGFGGSGGGRDRSFNFNLAGASRENQLANTLQGRFNQPLQAYVVSRDITNSQQLDEDIRNNASFG